MHFAELVRHCSASFLRIIDDNRKNKGLPLRHVVRAIDCQLPLEPEVALSSFVCVPRNDGDEQTAALDLLTNRLVPRLAATQLALVEPYLDAAVAKGFANSLGRLRVLGGVAEKHSMRQLGHEETTSNREVF